MYVATSALVEPFDSFGRTGARDAAALA